MDQSKAAAEDEATSALKRIVANERDAFQQLKSNAGIAACTCIESRGMFPCDRRSYERSKIGSSVFCSPD
jgi:hypothetical protein